MNLPPRSGQFEPAPVLPGIAPLSDAKKMTVFSYAPAALSASTMEPTDWSSSHTHAANCTRVSKPSRNFASKRSFAFCGASNG